MKKTFLTLAISLAMLLVLAFSAYAAEYTVSDNKEYQSAYEQAVNGDTIIIDDKLTCDIYANKSITYILKADWESARLVVNQSNVEVSFIADGEDCKIMPTNYSATDGWMNIAEVYANVVINLGGINGGTVTIDGTNATHDRVSYVTASNTADITWNFFNGSAVANFNPQVSDASENAFIIYSRNINMYEGSRIYANRIINAPLMRATQFNLYGGEIFGNILESTRKDSKGAGAIYVSERILIYGGHIYKNIFNVKSSSQINYVGFFTTPSKKDTVILDLQIGDTYVTGSNSNEVSAMFGTTNPQFNTAKLYYNSGMQRGTRYQFSDTPALAFDEATGKTIWQVSSFKQLSTDWTGRSWTHTDTPGNKIAVFLDAEKKSIGNNNFDAYTLINAYIEGVYAYSGSTTINIPSGYELWSTSGTEYCHTGKAYNVDEVKAANTVLYSAYNADRVTVDGTTMCSGCGIAYACSNPNHDLETVSISYTKYTENGIKVLKCNTCGLEKATETTASPLFNCLGYSAPEDGRGGIAIGFTVNNVAIAEYEETTGKILKYGVFAVLQSRLGDNDVFAEDGTAAEGVINADITSYEFALFELKIVGFTDEQKDTKLAMGAYVAVTDGETTEYSYMQGGEPNENEKYCFVSYNDIVGSAEEVTQ